MAMSLEDFIDVVLGEGTPDPRGPYVLAWAASRDLWLVDQRTALCEVTYGRTATGRVARCRELASLMRNGRHVCVVHATVARRRRIHRGRRGHPDVEGNT